MARLVEIDGWRLSPETVRWGAEQVIRMHEERPTLDRPSAGRCNRCPNGRGMCDQLAMARVVLDAFAVVAR